MWLQSTAIMMYKNFVMDLKTLLITIPTSCIAFLVGYVIICHYTPHSYSSAERLSSDDDEFQKEKLIKLKPYSKLQHPSKCLLDKLLSPILGWMLLDKYKLPTMPSGMHYYTTTDTDTDGEKKKQKNTKLYETLKIMRKAGQKSSMSRHEITCQKWNNLLQKKTNGKSTLMTGIVHVTCNSNVLKDLGFQYDDRSHSKEENEDEEDEEMSTTIDMMMTCSSSAILNKQDIIQTQNKTKINNNNNETTSYDLISNKVKFDDLKLSSSTEILIYFHGGGFMIGDTTDLIADFAYSLTTLQMKEEEESKKKEKDEDVEDVEERPLVILSVDYRLTPEHPFPAGIIDCLSATFTVLDTISKHQSIHIGGISAGGNLAYVTTLEAMHKYPGRIQSSVILEPMLFPKCNTTSYYLNSKSSWVSVDILKFWWCSYLQLEEEKTIPMMNNDIQDFSTLRGSNLSKDLMEMGWIPSKKKKNDNDDTTTTSGGEEEDYYHPLWRLCCPSLQTHLNNDPSSSSEQQQQYPKFIVTSNSGDPLQDDGRKLVEYLKREKQTCIHIEPYGSHSLWLVFDSKSRSKLIQTWYEFIWKNKTNKK